MQPRSMISTIWTDPAAAQQYRTGLSLHSHTSCSEETLTFIHKILRVLPGLQHVFRHYERQGEKRGVDPTGGAASWTAAEQVVVEDQDHRPDRERLAAGR